MQRWLAGIVALFSYAAFAADPPAEAQAEIAHLLSHLASSNCQFYRNGTWYGPSDAAAHLNSKYQYLRKKGWVPTAEAFIERAATASSVSGKPYLVRCAGAKPVDSAGWLREELSRYRGAAK